jgi:NitT/TauT family transport system ATP-binding protein
MMLTTPELTAPFARDGSLAARPAVVEIKAADKTYANGTRALAPVSLSFFDGEFVTLIGPSGCGKSTLLKLIANLIEPTRGEIRWWGESFGKVGTQEHKLSFVFQDATLMPWARVAGNVRLPLDLAQEPSSVSAKRVEKALGWVGLENFARHYPRQLSGGMRMRVSIARALVTEPNLLLMDEPFGALDEFTRNRLDNDLLRLSAEQGFTTVFVTHSIYEAVFLSTRVIVLAAGPGRVLADLAINEPLPRDDSFRNSVRFAEYCRELSALLNRASQADREMPR